MISQEGQWFHLAFGCGEANGQEGRVGVCVGMMWAALTSWMMLPCAQAGGANSMVGKGRTAAKLTLQRAR